MVNPPFEAAKAPFLGRVRRLLGRHLHELGMRLQTPTRLVKRQQPWPSDRPLATIVVPCFNYGRYLDEAVRSALEQTLVRTEIIVIDDGSDDPYTLERLAAVKHCRARVIRQPNLGLAATRNVGAAVARGKYICYLDADDTLEPEYLERMLVELEQDETLGSCFSWVRCFGDDDSIWKTRSLDPYYLHECTTAPSHSVIRRTAWERVKALNGSGFLTKYNGYFEDWVFWIDMVECGYRGQVVPEALIRYRIHPNSLGATHRAGFARMLDTLHADRRDFFGKAAYRRQLGRRLNRRIQVENPEITLATMASATS